MRSWREFTAFTSGSASDVEEIFAPVDVKYLSASVANFLRSAAFVPVFFDCARCA